ncbi:uncharacterized protein LOC113298586 isoform X3 [Papaver somniferum]|uniref:uncharacterized protein LOC113298586 isoform X3 n=1 Tax=Papaver somniferum TaxID=3469 RepID=UPI000E6FC4DF|nr:uncharacterized protein LOC113298586 isoform X3 [Papaver somniferum]
MLTNLLNSRVLVFCIGIYEFGKSQLKKFWCWYFCARFYEFWKSLDFSMEKILSPEASRLQSEFAKTVTAVAQWRWWWPIMAVAR